MKPAWPWLLAAVLGTAVGVWLERGPTARFRAAASPPGQSDLLSDQHFASHAEGLNRDALPPVLAAERDFLDRLRATPVDDLPALWEEAIQSEEGKARLRLILDRWTRLDPQGAAAAIRPQGSDMAQRGDGTWGRLLYAAWFSHDPAAALATARQEKGHFFTAACNGLWSVAQYDPSRFFQLAHDAPEMLKEMNRHALTEKGLHGLLAFAREDMLALAENMSDEGRGKFEAVFVKSFAETDLEAAIARVQTLKTPHTTYRAATALMPTLLEQDWRRAGEVLEKLEVGEPSSGLTWALLPALREQLAIDPRQVANWIGTHLAKAEWTRDALLGALSAEALATHPEAALELGTFDVFAGRSFLMLNQPLGEPSRMLEAAEHAPASAYRDVVTDQSVRQWLRDDAAAAQAWAARLPEGEFKHVVTSALAGQDDDASTRLFHLSLAGVAHDPDAEVYRKLLAITAMERSQSDQEATLARLSDLTEESVRQPIVTEIAELTAFTSPKEALAWLADWPHEADLLRALPPVIEAWAGGDPPAVSEWLVTLEPGPVRDEAVAAFAENVWRIEPEAAVLWAATLAPGERRVQTLETILPPLLQRDPAAARVLLDQAALTAEERAYWKTYQPPAVPSE